MKKKRYVFSFFFSFKTQKVFFSSKKKEMEKKPDKRKMKYDNKTCRVRITESLNEKLKILQKELKMKTLHEVISFLLEEEDKILFPQCSNEEIHKEGKIHFKDLPKLEACPMHQPSETISSFLDNPDIHCHCFSTKDTCQRCNDQM